MGGICLVADCNVIPDRQWHARVSVEHCAILDVGTLTHSDGLVIVPTDSRLHAQGKLRLGTGF